MFYIKDKQTGKNVKSAKYFFEVVAYFIPESKDLDKYIVTDDFGIDFTALLNKKLLTAFMATATHYPYLALSCLNRDKVMFLSGKYVNRLPEIISEISYPEEDRITIQREAVKELLKLSANILKEEINHKFELAIIHKL